MTTMPDIELPFTRFTSAKDNAPVLSKVGWGELTRILTSHRPVKLTLPPEITEEEAKKILDEVKTEHPAFSPVLYKKKTKRAKANVICVYAFVVDLDDGSQFKSLRSRFVNAAGKPLAFIWYTTFKSRVTCPRIRIVFLLKSPVPADQWTDAWQRLSHALADGHNDENTKDASRLHFLPACPEMWLDEADAGFQEGELLDPADYPEIQQKPSVKAKQPPRTQPLDVTDEDLLKIAFRAENGTETEALFRGDTSRFDGDESRADQSLCSRLAFYTGNDSARLDRLFRSSQLLRPKWDEVHYANGDTYGEATIRKAIEGCGEFYSPKGVSPEPRAGRMHNIEVGSTKEDGKEGTAAPVTQETPLPYPPGGYNLTDLGNAERLIHRHGRDLRFNKAFGWLAFDGKVWKTDDSGEVYRRMKETVRYIHSEAADVYSEAARMEERKAELARQIAALPAGDNTASKALQLQMEGIEKEAVKTAARAKEMGAWAFKSEGASRIEAAVSLAEKEAGVYAEPSIFDADPLLLNCQNGMVDLRTGELRAHKRGDYCTRITAVPYDPNAQAPLWESSQQRWQTDSEVRAFLQRAAGYSLTGHTGEETAFLLYGTGRNGKSKFTGALEYILGDYAGRARIELFMQGRGGNEGNGPTPDTANLAGKRLIIASEIMQARRFNEAFVKDIPGGDIITAARKFKDPFTFKPCLKLWFYGNHKPIIGGADDGIKSRLPLVPFTNTIPVEERDTHLDAKLRDEGAGILAWAVRGCLQWQKQRLSPPPAVVRASEDYHEAMDVMAGFFKARCIFGGEKTIWTPTADLRFALTEWAKGEGIDEKELPKPGDFADRLRRAGCDDNNGKPLRHNRKLARCWSNVRLRTDEDPTDEEQEATEQANTHEETGQTCYAVTLRNGVTDISSKVKNEFSIGKEFVNSVTERNSVTVEEDFNTFDDEEERF